jgi:hypothetical protein
MDIDQAKLLLESRGIPVFIGNEDSARNWGLVYPARRYALWIPLNEQFEDAKALFNNKDHDVSLSVDVEEYYKNMDKLRTKSVKNIFHKLMLFIILLSFISYITFIIYRIFIK